MKITDFRGSITPTHDEPNPERLLSSNSPARTTWEHYLSRDQAFSCGIWACDPGHWRIRFAANKHEFFCVSSGRVRLHAESGMVTEVGPGEAAVIPAGFIGSFEVVETVRKFFVVYESPLSGD